MYIFLNYQLLKVAIDKKDKAHSAKDEMVENMTRM